MEIHEFEGRFEKALEAFNSIGERLADAKAQSWLLQEMRKVKNTGM